jgi:hypothetical protein
MANDYAFKTGTATVLEGQIVPDPATLLPSGGVYVTDTAAPPTTYVTPLVLDHTATTGGLYAWDGAAYVQVGAALS